MHQKCWCSPIRARFPHHRCIPVFSPCALLSVNVRLESTKEEKILSCSVLISQTRSWLFRNDDVFLAKETAWEEQRIKYPTRWRRGGTNVEVTMLQDRINFILLQFGCVRLYQIVWACQACRSYRFRIQWFPRWVRKDLGGLRTTTKDSNWWTLVHPFLCHRSSTDLGTKLLII